MIEKYADYTIFDWMGEIDISDLNKTQAKKIFSFFVEGKESRTEELKKLVGSDLYLHNDFILSKEDKISPKIIERKIPKKKELDHSLESLQALNEWLIRDATNYSNTLDEEKKKEYFTTKQPFYRCDKLWKSIATDCSIYLAEILEKECNSLYWELGSSKKSYIARHYPEIKGFPKVSWAEYGISPTYNIYIYVCGIIFAQKEPKVDKFIGIYNSCKWIM